MNSRAMYADHVPSRRGLPTPLDEMLAPLLHGALASRQEDAFSAVCDAALAHGVLPERLLVLLKRQWRQLAASRGMPRIEADQILELHVTRCIKEYYRPRHAVVS